MVNDKGPGAVKSNPFLSEFVSRIENAQDGRKVLKPSDWITKYTRTFDKEVGDYVAFDFDHHPYQRQIVDADGRDIAVKKACQLGFTEIFVREALEMVGNRGLTVILTQPDFEMSRGFAQSRVNPVIDRSPLLKELIKNSNSVNLKQIKEAFLHIKYTKGDESHALSVPADAVIADEVDHSDLETLNLFRSRLEHSKHKIFKRFGTPTVPGFGICKAYDESDQWSFGFKCPHCGEWEEQPGHRNLSLFPVAEFEQGLNDFSGVYSAVLENIAMKSFVMCRKCGKSVEDVSTLLIPELSNNPCSLRVKREWIQLNPGAVKTVKGFQINQVSSGIKTGQDLITSIKGFESIRDVYNQVFGEGFISAVDTIRKEDLQWVPYNVDPAYSFMGMDFGLTCMVSVEAWDEVEKTTIPFKIYEIPLFTFDNETEVIDRVVEIIAKHNVVCGVVDAMPYQNSVNSLKKRCPVAMFDCYLKDNIAALSINKDKTIRGSRTQWIDGLLTDVKLGKRIFPNSLRPYEGMITTQLGNFRRVVGKDGKYTYPPIKPDHYGFASIYAKLARIISESHPDLLWTDANPLPFIHGKLVLNGRDK